MWGHALVSGVVDNWWERWCHRSADSFDLCLNELKEIASRKSAQAKVHSAPSPELAAWLQAMNGPELLDAETARYWFYCRIRAERLAREAKLPRRHIGPDAARDPQQRPTAGGKAVIHRGKDSQWVLEASTGSKFGEQTVVDAASVVRVLPYAHFRRQSSCTTPLMPQGCLLHMQ